MIDMRTWSEFKESGLLWFVNSILHLFGWAIVVEISEEGNETTAYPARVSFRGFSESVTDDGYRLVTDYLKQNIDELVEDFKR